MDEAQHTVVEIFPPADVAELLQNAPLLLNGPAGEPTLDYGAVFGASEFVALLFSAGYCASCREFAPKFLRCLAEHMGPRHKVRAVLIAGDRTQEAYDEYISKFKQDLVSLPFGACQEVKTALRDRFAIRTIPHVVLLDAAGKVVENNIRFAIEEDPAAANFPWRSAEADANAASGGGDTKEGASASSNHDMKYGMMSRVPFLTAPSVFQLGHRAKTGSTEEYMDEHAVRIRAGVLNTISWIAILNVTVFNNQPLVFFLYCLVCWEFVFSSMFGLTPFAPIGVLATLLARLFAPGPHWKPAKPKRFAWVIGLVLVNICFFGFLVKPTPNREFIWVPLLTCNLFTWLECACGFCAGCFMWNNMIVPAFKLNECSECKL